MGEGKDGAWLVAHVMSYAIEIKASAKKELAKLPAKGRRQVSGAIDRLSDDPRPPPPRSIKLTDSGGKRRLRTGNYRVLYEVVDEKLIVYVIAVADRKDAYKRK